MARSLTASKVDARRQLHTRTQQSLKRTTLRDFQSSALYRASTACLMRRSHSTERWSPDLGIRGRRGGCEGVVGGAGRLLLRYLRLDGERFPSNARRTPLLRRHGRGSHCLPGHRGRRRQRPPGCSRRCAGRRRRDRVVLVHRTAQQTKHGRILSIRQGLTYARSNHATLLRPSFWKAVGCPGPKADLDGAGGRPAGGGAAAICQGALGSASPALGVPANTVCVEALEPVVCRPAGVCRAAAAPGQGC